MKGENMNFTVDRSRKRHWFCMVVHSKGINIDLPNGTAILLSSCLHDAIKKAV